MTNVPTYHLICAIGANEVDEAIRHLKKAHIALQMGFEIPENPSMVDVADAYAKYLRCIDNNPEKALQYFRKTLAMMTRILTGE